MQSEYWGSEVVRLVEKQEVVSCSGLEVLDARPQANRLYVGKSVP